MTDKEFVVSDELTTQPAPERVVHGIDRYSGRHLCGERFGWGTDSREPGMTITCAACRAHLVAVS